MDVDDFSPEANPEADAQIKLAQEILNSISSVKQSLSHTTVVPPVVSTMGGRGRGRGRGKNIAISREPVTVCALIDDEIDADFYIPEIKSASERIKERKLAQSRSLQVNADLFKLPAATSAAPPADNTPKVRVQTRLNGTHKLGWNLPIQQKIELVCCCYCPAHVVVYRVSSCFTKGLLFHSFDSAYYQAMAYHKEHRSH